MSESLLAFVNNHALISYLIIVILSIAISPPLKMFIGRILFKITLSTEGIVDDYMVDALRPFRFVYVLPVAIGFFLSNMAEPYAYIAKVICGLLFIALAIDTISKLLNGLGEVLRHKLGATGSSYASIIDLSRLVVFLLGIAVIIAIFFETSPSALLGGIGALTAVLMLVFKDTVLSVVASIQNATWDYFREDDWVSVPDFGADGFVERIGLYNVKLRNWDNTTSLIPTHRILNVKTKNYRSMFDRRSRQIYRSIYIDIETIRFCDHSLLESLSKIKSISKTVVQQIKLIDDVEELEGLVQRKTNLDLFRLYTEKFLHKHNDIHKKNHILIVRDREPGPEGLPMQILAYSKKSDIKGYEKIQSNVFTHLIGIMHIFELKVFQRKVGGNE